MNGSFFSFEIGGGGGGVVDSCMLTNKASIHIQKNIKRLRYVLEVRRNSADCRSNHGKITGGL